MTDWPDPRIPEHKMSRLEISIVGALVVIPTLVFLWGLIEPIARSVLPS